MTTRRGCFKKEELAKLASALGFPSNIFIKELRKSSNYYFEIESDYARLEDGKAITAEGLNHVLESGALNHRLEKIFNKYDAQYNIKVIVKAVSLLADRQLSFSEVAIARMAFEVYSMEDGSGLPAELGPVSQALKLMDRVMAPTRLEAEIAKQQHYCELPSRIQMYEFYDLAVRCLKLSEAEREMDVQIGRNVNDAGALTTASSDTSLPDISKMLMTTDQRILDYLDERYKSSMFKMVDPTPAPLDDQRIVSMAPRRILRSMSKEHSCAIVPPLERSQQQLHQARSGRGMVLSATQCASVEGSIQSSRPHTSLSMDHRSRNTSISCRSRLSQNAMQWSRNRTPSSRLTDRSMKDPVFLSKSAPNILLDSGEEHVSDAAMDSGDISDAISKICVDSVYRAREAVCSSVASLPQVDPHMDNRRGSVLVSNKLCRRKLSRRLCTPTLPIVRLTPIITKEEMKRHHDSISELEWERLRKAKK